MRETVKKASHLLKITTALLVVLCFSFLGCSSYTTELQKGVGGADETAAIAALRAVALAQRTYSLTNNGEYGTFPQLVQGGFLDERYAKEKGIRDYVLTLNVTPKSDGAPEGSYTCNADPEVGVKGGRHLYIDSTSSGIHVNETQPATAADKVMQ